MKQEMERHQKFNTLVTKTDDQSKIKMPEVNIKEYAKYLLTNGTRDEKREIIGCIKTEMYLKNQKVYLNNNNLRRNI